MHLEYCQSCQSRLVHQGRCITKQFTVEFVIAKQARYSSQQIATAELIIAKLGHARVFNLVSFVSSTAFRPVKYRSLCYWGKFSRRGAFRFHSFQFSEVRLQVCSDW